MVRPPSDIVPYTPPGASPGKPVAAAPVAGERGAGPRAGTAAAGAPEVMIGYPDGTIRSSKTPVIELPAKPSLSTRLNDALTESTGMGHEQRARVDAERAADLKQYGEKYDQLQKDWAAEKARHEAAVRNIDNVGDPATRADRLRKETALYNERNQQLAGDRQVIQKAIETEVNRRATDGLLNQGRTDASAPMRETSGKKPGDPGFRGMPGDSDSGAGPRTANLVEDVVRDMGIKETVQNKAGLVKIGGDLKMTINKEGPMGQPGSTAHQTQIRADSVEAETYVSEPMKGKAGGAPQAGQTYVQIQDYKKTALPGLAADPKALALDPGMAHDLIKGTAKTMEKLTDAELREVLKKNGMADVPPEVFRERMQTMKADPSPGTKSPLSYDGGQKMQEISRDIFRQAEAQSLQKAKADMTALETQISNLEKTGNKAQAQALREQLVDSRTRMLETTKANGGNIDGMGPKGPKPGLGERALSAAEGLDAWMMAPKADAGAVRQGLANAVDTVRKVDAAVGEAVIKKIGESTPTLSALAESERAAKLARTMQAGGAVLMAGDAVLQTVEAGAVVRNGKKLYDASYGDPSKMTDKEFNELADQTSERGKNLAKGAAMTAVSLAAPIAGLGLMAYHGAGYAGDKAGELYYEGSDTLRSMMGRETQATRDAELIKKIQASAADSLKRGDTQLRADVTEKEYMDSIAKYGPGVSRAQFIEPGRGKEIDEVGAMLNGNKYNAGSDARQYLGKIQDDLKYGTTEERARAAKALEMIKSSESQGIDWSGDQRNPGQRTMADNQVNSQFKQVYGYKPGDYANTAPDSDPVHAELRNLKNSTGVDARSPIYGSAQEAEEARVANVMKGYDRAVERGDLRYKDDATREALEREVRKNGPDAGMHGSILERGAGGTVQQIDGLLGSGQVRPGSDDATMLANLSSQMQYGSDEQRKAARETFQQYMASRGQGASAMTADSALQKVDDMLRGTDLGSDQDQLLKGIRKQLQSGDPGERAAAMQTFNQVQAIRNQGGEFATGDVTPELERIRTERQRAQPGSDRERILDGLEAALRGNDPEARRAARDTVRDIESGKGGSEWASNQSKIIDDINRQMNDTSDPNELNRLTAIREGLRSPTPDERRRAMEALNSGGEYDPQGGPSTSPQLASSGPKMTKEQREAVARGLTGNLIDNWLDGIPTDKPEKPDYVPPSDPEYQKRKGLEAYLNNMGNAGGDIQKKMDELERERELSNDSSRKKQIDAALAALQGQKKDYDDRIKDAREELNGVGKDPNPDQLTRLKGDNEWQQGQIEKSDAEIEQLKAQMKNSHNSAEKEEWARRIAELERQKRDARNQIDDNNYWIGRNDKKPGDESASGGGDGGPAGDGTSGTAGSGPSGVPPGVQPSMLPAPGGPPSTDPNATIAGTPYTRAGLQNDNWNSANYANEQWERVKGYASEIFESNDSSQKKDLLNRMRGSAQTMDEWTSRINDNNQMLNQSGGGGTPTGRGGLEYLEPQMNGQTKGPVSIPVLLGVTAKMDGERAKQLADALAGIDLNTKAGQIPRINYNTEQQIRDMLNAAGYQGRLTRAQMAQMVAQAQAGMSWGAIIGGAVATGVQNGVKTAGEKTGEAMAEAANGKGGKTKDGAGDGGDSGDRTTPEGGSGDTTKNPESTGGGNSGGGHGSGNGEHVYSFTCPRCHYGWAGTAAKAPKVCPKCGKQVKPTDHGPADDGGGKPTKPGAKPPKGGRTPSGGGHTHDSGGSDDGWGSSDSSTTTPASTPPPPPVANEPNVPHLTDPAPAAASSPTPATSAPPAQSRFCRVPCAMPGCVGVCNQERGHGGAHMCAAGHVF